MNPYLGYVNPGTTEGLKLYKKSIEARSDKIETNQDNARDIQTIFQKSWRLWMRTSNWLSTD